MSWLKMLTCVAVLSAITYVFVPASFYTASFLYLFAGILIIGTRSRKKSETQ